MKRVVPALALCAIALAANAVWVNLETRPAAHDFSNQAARLAALREKVPGLEGVAEGAGISQVLERLITRSQGPLTPTR